MDFLFGIIIGAVGFAIIQKVKEEQIKKNSPRRGRPPNKVEVKDEH